jgi:hypothetical protein
VRRATLRDIHRGLESQGNVIHVVGEQGVAYGLNTVLFLGIVVFNLLIKALAFSEEVLELADGCMLVVLLFVDSI